MVNNINVYRIYMNNDIFIVFMMYRHVLDRAQ